MLSDDEKGLYYNIAKSYTGKGAVIEIGPWLGSGTIQICRGLESSGCDWRLTVIDRFRWSKLYEDRYTQVGLSEGEDFKPVFLNNLESFAPRIQCITTELQSLRDAFQFDQPIEIIFIDAPKSWSLLWSVLEYLGPRLLGGARVVFQDYLHITSRQLIWLLASISQLKLSQIVENGTASTFVADGPIDDLGAQVSPSINSLSADSLLQLWEAVRAQLPEARAGEVSVGMALDLLKMGANEAALGVLDTIQDHPSKPIVLTEVDRLIRYSDKKDLVPLIQASAYLRFDIPPEDIAAGWARQAKEKSSVPAGRAVKSVRGIECKEMHEVTRLLRSPSSGLALSALYSIHHSTSLDQFRRSQAIFELAVETGTVAEALERAPLTIGKDVVELNAGYSLVGLSTVANGAKSYTSVISGYDPNQRTFAGSRAGIRVRTKHNIGSIVESIEPFRIVSDSIALEDGVADIVVVEIFGQEDPLRRALSDFTRLARPGASLWLRWINPYSWSGHGGAPRRVSEINKADPKQKAVLDWRHVSRMKSKPPTLNDVRDIVERSMVIEQWTPVLDDPMAVLRMSPEIFSSHAPLTSQDLSVAAVTLVARPKVQ
jgi:hypothetical protein